MTRVRRLTASAAAALAVALAATACGTTDVKSPARAAASPPSRDCAGDTTATSKKPVTLTDGVGRTVKLDKPARRIAVLEWQQVEDALTLCVTPVAVADPKGYRTWVSAEKLPAGVTDIGTRDEPDLDTLLAAKPDLVVVEAFDAKDKTLTALEKRGIPVLATRGANPKDPIGNVRDVFDMIGAATGRTERARQVDKQFDDHFAAAKKKVTGADLPTKDFLFFDGWLEGGNLTVRPYGKGALFTAIGEELGMKPAWTDKINKAYGDGGVDPAYGLAQTDVEGLTAVGGANLFYANDEGAGGYVKALAKNPVWKSLPAVKQGRAHAFPARVWGAGGPRSCEQAIDAYVDVLTQKTK
ncbi:iron-siderophore ABC transporter substrate-binding protein [Streptomyces sp. NPDC004549]|uniref:iron-siderophore ABC transporter substrate-binding protein n=1 Tax=Streptomyces sp. NPDC004549 TaxID=3154283 RepID=UPI0033A90126